MSEPKETTKQSTVPHRGKTELFDNFGYAVAPPTLEGIRKYRPMIAEFFAMTLFVWIGCGTAVSTQSILALNPASVQDNTFHVSVSLAFGIAIAVLVYTIAPISGGHINPAVTFAFVMMGEMEIWTGVRYVLAQCLGALLGASLVWGSTASDQVMEYSGEGVEVPPFLIGSNFVAATLPLASAFLGECIGTFLLVWTVILTAVDPKSIAGNLAPIAIGWSVALAHFVLVPLTGCGINPARSLGPHLVIIMAGEKAGTEGWWVYYTAPFVGAAVAVLACKILFDVQFSEEEEAKKPESPDEAAEEEVKDA